MKHFTKLVLGAALGAALAGATPAFADLKMGVAAEPYPPFTSKDASGKWVGWEIDFMNALCADIGEKCAVEEVAWDGIIPALQAKKFDAILSSMSITEERQKTIAFSNMYYNSLPVLIGPKGADKDISPAHLKGKNVGVQVSTIHAAYAKKYFEPAGAVIKTYETQDQVNADLAAGRLDYILADGVTLDDFLKSDQGGCCEQKGAVPYDEAIFGVGVGLGIRKEDTALQAKFNKGIADLAANGTFAKITEQWKLTGKLKLPGAK
ncbi:MAG: transporter substrate-binding domain-containing protein [Alphaproteobacteria bacterium]|nr:transporter substrate-binding domain-containing protein [Alphaproteobacteria bacterium]